MRLPDIIRAAMLPLTLSFLAIGCILLLVGTGGIFSTDPRQVQRDGLTRQLDFFSDCESKVAADMPSVRAARAGNATDQAPGGGTEAGGGGSSGGGVAPEAANNDMTGLLVSRCQTQQRPYKWLLYFTGAEVGLTFLLLLWMVYKAPSGLLSWLAIQTAVVLTLVIVTIYAGMQLMTQTKDLVDCAGVNTAARADIEREGFACYNNPNRPSASRLLDHWLPIFWVGAGFAIGGLGMLTLLVSLMQWAKTRKFADREDLDDDEYYRTRTDRTATTAATGAGAGWGLRGKRDRTLHDRERDTAAGTGTGIGRTHRERDDSDYERRRARSPTFIDHMMGRDERDYRDRADRDYRGDRHASRDVELAHRGGAVGTGAGVGSGGARYRDERSFMDRVMGREPHPSQQYPSSAHYPATTTTTAHHTATAAPHTAAYPSTAPGGPHVSSSGAASGSAFGGDRPGFVDRMLGRDVPPSAAYPSTATASHYPASGSPAEYGPGVHHTTATGSLRPVDDVYNRTT